MIRFRTIEPEAAAKLAAPSAAAAQPAPAKAGALAAGASSAETAAQELPPQKPVRAKKQGAARLFDE
ncbi:hypothetical protein [Bosea sp. BIWAKO-01]|uniref:hypothetical protein n=1 Tax=Bosea sp. BIWAKO-01 TaxID=506668 RepID=UPI00085377A6|nr:hypothetical protein [Bosea sp. BIWAKO-01]GAU83668.1 hypothetical protein BIWAKO_03595 [Bosea sp. BIWAKO-01]